ncbi:PhoH family protein [Sinanaerobacter chloroacetimidivorans]|uniref:PhoH-like protein n=1 Tax=Sinanaerobacter chloroacetimidivorans TaxID=2818044 RepID=A0A8J7VX64_9FIRM|nr:PhoH family protein [Sinanaerobacter chloroacetimidivorans]MBR0596346.1 PhoH family protein [Sinanaerobacter chloroacetimidivorans]
MENLLIEELKIKIDHEQDTNELFGNLDVNLKIIQDNYDVSIVQRQDEIILKGKEAAKAQEVIVELLEILQTGEKLDAQKVNYVISLNNKGISYKESNINKDVICFTHRGKPIKPKTIGQTSYAQSIKKHDIVFGVGPAGTGKTYIAVAMAINAFKNKDVQKIILARPAVEAGERLGFLPGDLQEKVDPYLRPLYDALYDILGRDSALRLKEKEIIEVVPLAYMRGRTLDNSFIILDEAQNTTKEQMKMFLTRLGFGSKAVVTGDITQIDLPRGKKSGLVDAVKVLDHVEGIEFCFLKDSDVVRHALVRRIINAYDRYAKENPEEGEE